MRPRLPAAMPWTRAAQAPERTRGGLTNRPGREREPAEKFGTIAAVAAIALLSMLGGCSLWRPVTIPMSTLAAPSPCHPRPDTLLVMLPGAYSRPDEFLHEGFVRAVHERGVLADVLLVDAHVGYYAEKSIVERLHADVIEPALAQGYAHIWLVGISIGGFGSLIYSEARPQGISGVVTIGPYLGKPRLIDEIAAQGGLRSWVAPPGPLGVDDADQVVWRWLQTDAATRPAVFLGYGREDRFSVSHRLLAGSLPPHRVFTATGGHDWAPWLAVWKNILDAMPLKRDAACAA